MFSKNKFLINLFICLQCIAEKLKRHTLITVNGSDNQADSGDDEKQHLIQIQEDDDKRATQRYCILKK